MSSIQQAQDDFQSGRFGSAAAACRTILSRDIEDDAALSLLGRVLLAEGRRAEGIALLMAARAPDEAGRAALATALEEVGLRDSPPPTAPGPPADPAPVRPDDADAWLDMGNAHLMADRLELAEQAYRGAIQRRPRYAGALGNLGNVLTARGCLPEAHAAYRSALEVEPDNADIGFAFSLSLLRAGEFRDGWRWHECRRRVAGLRWNYDRHPDLPQWRDGMDLTGRRVLVMAEQGRGDMIQFARLVPLLAERVERVVLELPLPLHRLFHDLPGVARLIDRDAAATDCDIACPLLSLPRVLDLTEDRIPPPAITARQDLRAQWSAWCGEADGRLRIGLVVSGESRHPHDARRSIPLAMFAPILDGRYQVVIVQTELRDADRDTRETLDGLRFPGAALTDFADTAGLLANLDLIISVDTAAAHLAGSLGIPVWLLLAHAADHRWMLGRSDSPWYPSMRLFRQPVPGDWASVIAELGGVLDRSDLGGEKALANRAWEG